MKSIDLTPLYRNSVGFDHLASLLNNAMRTETVNNTYPPYNIEVLGENQYAITLSVAGFTQDELDINVEKNTLTIRGQKANKEQKEYLYQGIANRTFERKFNLADHIEARGAELNNGLLTVNLVKEIPEAMKPRTIAINTTARSLENTGAESANQEDSQSQEKIA